jgi:MFS transporter, FSR family, fosmidomycin resistance protein
MAETQSEKGREIRIVGLVCAAHFVSHYHILLLPPVFEVVRGELGVSYVALGAVLTAFNVISALLQTPAGFLVDRVGARPVLIGGMTVGVGALLLAAAFPSYWMLILAYALLGLANTVYHPADYSILSSTITPKKAGRAFSFHTFSGFFGSGVAPACVLACAAYAGWQGAFYVAAALSALVIAALVIWGAPLSVGAAARREAGSQTQGKAGLDLLLSAPILRNLFFFVLLALSGGGIQTFSVVALGQMNGTPASTANIALSGYLLMSAAGVLAGGILADRTARHERVAAAGFLATSTMVVAVGWGDLGAAALIGAMSLGGFLNGIIQPSRDMIVRSVTPPGAFGKVFGFVSTGFNIGGMISPLLYAWLLDRGEPRMVFALVTVFVLLALFTVITRPKPRPATPAAAPAE